jgi:hypothetical protein
VLGVSCPAGHALLAPTDEACAADLPRPHKELRTAGGGPSGGDALPVGKRRPKPGDGARRPMPGMLSRAPMRRFCVALRATIRRRRDRRLPPSAGLARRRPPRARNPRPQDARGTPSSGASYPSRHGGSHRAGTRDPGTGCRGSVEQGDRKEAVRRRVHRGAPRGEPLREARRLHPRPGRRHRRRARAGARCRGVGVAASAAVARWRLWAAGKSYIPRRAENDQS